MLPMVCAQTARVTTVISDLKCRLYYCRADRRDYFGLAGLTASPMRNLPVPPEHEHGGRPQHIQPTDQIKPGLGVDLDMRDSIDHPGHLAEDLSGRPAWRAEGRGELQERGTGSERLAEICRAERGLADLWP